MLCVSENYGVPQIPVNETVDGRNPQPGMYKTL